MTLAQLKKASKSNLQKLTEQLEKVTTKQSIQVDDRLWYPDVDKAGNGFAIIRFLPEAEGEEVPFVRRYSHGFQQNPVAKTGPWLIENCPTTLGSDHPCPVCEHNTVLWNQGEKAKVTQQKRQLSFYSNVLIVSDPANPENNGQVKLFRYGKKIFDKLVKASKPNPALGEEPFNPFDPWTGANFRIIIGKVEGRRNYDESKFDAPAPIGTDQEIEVVWKQQYPLQPFIAPDQFKSYDALKARLVLVLGEAASDEPDVDDDVVTTAPVRKKVTKKATVLDDDDDDDAALARKLQALTEDDDVPF